MAAVNLRVAPATHVGKVRGNNEDDKIVVIGAGGGLYHFAVADGMGGHAAGEHASRIAVRAGGAVPAEAWLVDPEGALRQWFMTAHRALLESAAVHPERAGMGTTLTACVVVGDVLHVGHVGDSSAFLIRGERIKPLTLPAVGEMGGLGAGLGVVPAFFKDMDYARESLQIADVVILCTDGLTRYYDAPMICRVVRKTPFDEVADALVQKALDAGGEDNVTVIAALVG